MKKLFAAFVCISLFAGCTKTDTGNGNSTVTVVPLPPTDLQGLALSTTQVGLNWTDKSTNETGFKVQRKTGTETFKDIAILNTDVSTYTDNGLIPSTSYTYRVYAYNNVGNSITYTNEVTVTTKNITAVASLTTTTASSITQTTAISGGNISSDGGADITSRGIVWNTSTNPTIALPTKTTNGSGNGAFTSNITGLIANTTYYVRAYATNSVGTAYGNEVIFTTLPPLSIASLTTTSVAYITQTTAISGGNITSDGGTAVTARGVVWSKSNNPTVALSTKTIDGIGIGSFTSNVTRLTANTTYYLRAYATNSLGTAYGNEISIKTSMAPPPTNADGSGNTYPTVIIGTQTWMAENLRSTRYTDGSPIPLATDNEWLNNTISPMMCWYNNDQTTYTANKYGALYNWYAINPATNGNKNVCPMGWHVPTDAEWTTLTTFLGGESVAGGKMKNIGTQYWLSPNQDASNSSGFSGLPSGLRYGGGSSFGYIGNSGLWWSSTELTTRNASVRYLVYDFGSLYIGDNLKTVGYSVRCIKD